MRSCPDTDSDPDNVYKLTTIFVCVHQRVHGGGPECNQHILHHTAGYIEICRLSIVSITQLVD